MNLRFSHITGINDGISKLSVSLLNTFETVTRCAGTKGCTPETGDNCCRPYYSKVVREPDSLVARVHHTIQNETLTEEEQRQVIAKLCEMDSEEKTGTRNVM